MTKAAWLPTLALCLGCTHGLRSARTVTHQAPATEGTGSPVAIWDQYRDALAARMRDIALELHGVDFHYSGFGVRGFLPAGSHETLAIDVPANTCTTLVAIATDAVRDMDAALYAPDGSLLTQDAQPDAHPTLQVCVGNRAQRFYYSLRLYNGSGAFMIAGFRGHRDRLEQAQEVVGGRPGLASSASVQSDASDFDRLRALSTGLDRRGFSPWRGPFRVPLAAEQRVHVALSVDPAVCYAVVGFSSGGLGNLDMRIYDEQGKELAHDLSAESDAAVQFCADRDAQFSAEVHAAAGQGTALVAFYRGSHAAVGGHNALWLGSRLSAGPSRIPLADALAKRARGAAAEAYNTRSRPVRGRLSWGEAVSQRVLLRGGACSLVTATGGAGLGNLQLTLVDVAGRRLGESGGAGAVAAVRACVRRTTRAEAIIVARSGAGRYALSVWHRSPPGDLPRRASERSRGQLLTAIEEARTAGFRRQGPSPAGAVHVQLDPDAPALLPVRLRQGTCLRVHGVSDNDPGEIELRLMVGERTLARRTGFAPTLRLCTAAAQASEARLEVRSMAHATDAHVVVYERPSAGPRAP